VPSAQLKADMKKVGDTMLKEWLEKAGPEGRPWSTPTRSNVMAPTTFARSAMRPRCGKNRCEKHWTSLYDGAAWLAALFMVGVLVMVLLSIVGRQLHFNVPGTDAYAGYSMAGAGFLALAHTLKRNEHIRVTLLLSASSRAGGQRAGELGRCRPRCCWRLLFAFYSGAPGLAVAVPSTTSPPPTTPRRCGFPSCHGAGHLWCWHRLHRRMGAGAARAASISSDEAGTEALHHE
jgi:hypothetical protein